MTEAMSEKPDILTVAREVLEIYGPVVAAKRNTALEGRIVRLAQAVIDLSAAREAFDNADWQQVVFNGGPPCFHIEDGRFCLRAQRWEGHGKFHDFIANPMRAALDGKDLGGLKGAR